MSSNSPEFILEKNHMWCVSWGFSHHSHPPHLMKIHTQITPEGVWWHLSVIPASGRLKLEDHRFVVNLGSKAWCSLLWRCPPSSFQRVHPGAKPYKTITSRTRLLQTQDLVHPLKSQYTRVAELDLFKEAVQAVILLARLYQQSWTIMAESDRWTGADHLKTCCMCLSFSLYVTVATILSKAQS